MPPLTLWHHTVPALLKRIDACLDTCSILCFLLLRNRTPLRLLVLVQKPHALPQTSNHA